MRTVFRFGSSATRAARGALFSLLLLGAACSDHNDRPNPDAQVDADVMDPDAQVDGNVSLPDGGDAGDDTECRVIEGAPCPLVCVERCNGLDDDCDGVIDNNGRCDVPNAEAICDVGECALVACAEGFADCNADGSDGCEASLDSTDNCGLCGTVCSFVNAGARCVQGICVPDDCSDGFGNCDGNVANGCETSVQSAERCGSCNTACAAGSNAIAACEQGACVVAACLGAFGDCDGSADNGCETALDQPADCGACGVSCDALPHATGQCGAHGCEILACVDEFHDCNGLAGDGCEAALDQPQHCGACGNACDLPNVHAPLCEQGACTIDTDEANGGCEGDFADCNGDISDGCETSLSTVTDCGECDRSCFGPHGIGTCEDGRCDLTECAAGYGDCDGDDECESLAADAANCGACDHVCSGATPVCSAGRCRNAACPSGEGACGDSDVCVALNTAQHCGACGVTCPANAPHATATCASGACVLSCAEGFDDCDGLVSNGCETNLRTTSNCGACGTTCAIANATATCATGVCRVDTCSSQHGDCDMNGTSCETSLTLPTTCGACDVDCTGRAHTTGAGCQDGTCSFACGAGYSDCNGIAADGCETSITHASNCGACNNNCAELAHVAMATCGNQGCDVTACDEGFGDCDGLPHNGCERSLNTAMHCGMCGVACSFANAASSCGSGSCTMGACQAGFGNCDGNQQNGCETQLNTATHCGQCGSACSNGQVCNNGSCGPASCPAGFSLCGGSTCVDIRGSCPPWPGCNIAKPNDSNCGACGYTCPLYGGQHCCL